MGTTTLVGLDIKEEKVAQARQELNGLRDAILQTGHLIHGYPDAVSETDKAWWRSSIPPFFKRELLSNEREIDFVVHDITTPVPIPVGHFDLSFADFVLHHIWYEEGGPEVDEMTLSAARQMVNVIRDGGHIAVRELIRLEGRPPLDFPALFNRFQLDVIYHETDASWDVEIGTFIYRKPLPPATPGI